MRVYKKQEATNYYNKLKDKTDIYLFQEDIDKAGSKCFHVMDSKTIFTKIEKTAEPHYYEFWTDQMKLTFGVDIDFDIRKNNTKPEQLVTDVIKLVKEGAKKYYNYDYKTSNIIVLENDEMLQKVDNPNKYSAHVIFRGLEFQNCLVIKDFYLRLEKDYKISKYFVDKSIYNLTCLRLFLNSKMSKSAILVPKKLTIDDEQTCVCNMNSSKLALQKFFMKTMITYTLGSDKIITMKDIKNKQEALAPKMMNMQGDISNIDLEHILNNLPSKYCDDYATWIRVGMILYNHSTETNNLYDVWNEWSKQSAKYKSNEMPKSWKSFEKSKNKYTIGTLIKWARDEGVVNIFKNVKLGIEEIVTGYPSRPTQLDETNIKEKNITKLHQAKLTPDIYIPILKKKLIGVQSEKGTGKTSNLLTTLFTNKESWIDENSSILLISSRITFGYKLLGDLKEYGFELYSQVKDQKIRSNRIICQVDSLMRLDKTCYDIIIVDECETLARYITSSHFTKNNKASTIVSIFQMFLENANQVYILDADLSDRCINYYKNSVQLKSEDEFHLIINDFKPYNEYTINYCQYATWIRLILLKMKENKRLVIPMASNSKAKDLDKKIRESYPEKKILLIHKETSDEDKKSLLLKVNEEWIKYDVIIYTPSVCMGVSFDITGHFDYIFAYGCHESLGAQEWCQMIHRVRSPINKEIFVAIDQYKHYDVSEDTVTYNSVEKMLCSDYYLTHYELNNNVVQCKVKLAKQDDIDKNNLDKDIEDEEQEQEDYKKQELNIGNVAIGEKIYYYPHKDEPIYDLYVRNCWEMIENKLNFPASFFGYAKYKEYNLKYTPSSEEDKEILQEMKAIRSEREDLEEEEKINGITNADDITSEEYQEKIKQREEFVTKKDEYAIKKYGIRKCFNIFKKEGAVDESLDNGYLTKDFIAEYYNNDTMKWYRNLSAILSTDTQTSDNKLKTLHDNQQYSSKFNNCYMDFSSKNRYAYHYYPYTIINMIGFDLNNLSIKIAYPDLITKIYDVIAWCDERRDEISIKYGIKMSAKTKDLTKIDEAEQMKFINKIIEFQYGLRIKRINTSINKDNILYRLDDCDRWNNLPDKIEYTEEDMENVVNVYNLKRKIEPYYLERKQVINLNNLDTTNLDQDVFIDDD